MMRDGEIEQVGTAEQILNGPKNNYVASFIADVDRSRVLTAANIMVSPAAVAGPGTGPQGAHKLLSDGQLSWLVCAQSASPSNRRGTVCVPMLVE